jgi:regulator of protease activity HflC (stomatin/prohibitin superfamily)
MGPLIAIGVVVVFVIILIASNVRVVPQANAYVVERLGAYAGTWETGLHFKLPLIDRIASKVVLKERVIDFPPQPVITKDNVTMKIDTVVYYQITDPKLFTYGVSRPLVAIENLTATTLRNIIGQLELDETLTSRDLINTQMRSTLDVATDPWGIKVNRVEVKNILPPKDIQDAMEQQMRAERQRRKAILEAEGTKKAAILSAEGRKESAILDAEADKRARILRAEAKKEAEIREAEGHAEAIRQIQKATADGIEFIKATDPSQAVLALKSFEALEKVADGQATKLIIPSEMQNVASLVASITEVSKTVKLEDSAIAKIEE